MLYSPTEQSLVIVFRGEGEAYRYDDVSAEEWRAFTRAPSKGMYLNAVFKARHPRVERFGSVPGQLDGVAATGVEWGPLRDVPDGNVWGFFE